MSSPIQELLDVLPDPKLLDLLTPEELEEITEAYIPVLARLPEGVLRNMHLEVDAMGLVIEYRLLERVRDQARELLAEITAILAAREVE